MKIHKLVKRSIERFEVDPIEGGRFVRRDVIKPADDHAIAHDGKTYIIDEDGTFEVPHEVGAWFLKRDGWYEGPSPFPAEMLKKAVDAGKAAAKKSKAADDDSEEESKGEAKGKAGKGKAADGKEKAAAA